MKKFPLVPMKDEKKKVCDREGLVEILRSKFGYSEFRGRQLEAIEAVMSGKDCFCLMPTGGGKSMCYQIPSLAKAGIVLVVCPLIALMENQVDALREKGIAAEYLSSTQTPKIKEKIYEDLASGKPSLRLLYVTPELVATPGFMLKLTKVYNRGLLSLIAVDEAHCISSWGHDFRPSYRNLSSLRNHLPDVPILALTATAVPKVQKDVMTSLNLQNPLVLKSSFNRPNIYYEVRYKDLLEDVYADLSNQLKSRGDQCSIVYCLERTMCDNLSTHLLKAGISSAAYHAGLNSKLRSSVLNDWFSSRIQVVVATVAFGMGIDRKDVRIVCHFNVPKSMESFYQESGRAGRDQMPSTSLLYYGMEDRKKMEFILKNAENKKLQISGSQNGSSKKSLADFKQMTDYCEGSGCRRKKILENFGEQVNALLCKKSCDACKHPNLVSKLLDDFSSASKTHRLGASVYISLSRAVTEDQLTEYWNRDDEASDSGDDISESDDEAAEALNNLVGSKFSSKSGINKKMDILERAEEDYYRNKISSKQKNNHDKKFIPEALREAGKQRLLNSISQTLLRVGSIKIDIEASATMLESECYKKYGKVGKSFYNSQLASTVRWLSTSNSTEIMDRLGKHTDATRDDSAKCYPDPKPITIVTTENCKDQVCNTAKEISKEETQGISATQIKTFSRDVKELPPIPSFSEFVSRKGKESRPRVPLNSIKRPLPEVCKDVEKKMRQK